MDNKNIKEEKKTNTVPISYHTFIFPFLFERGETVSRKEFTEFLPALNEHMYEDAFVSNIEPDKALHDQYRYFNRAMRNAVYTTKFDESEIVWNYRYDIEKMANNGKYTGKWRKTKKTAANPARFVIEKDSFRADLGVNGVRLKLFNTGVGMLIFELENYHLTSETDIIKINEFGRRVFMPYIKSDKEKICSICADNISLVYDGTVIEEASGSLNADKLVVDEIKLAPIIKFFLSNGKKGITTSPNPKKNEFYIEPIVDDRMFVACIYNNESFADDIKHWNRDEKVYKYLSDAEALKPDDENSLARRLYEMMFVDGDGMTCYNRIMLRELLEKHTYGRWLERGTITGITEYSMITVTSGILFLALPFLVEYIEMAILVLAQRASLLAFERIISEIACGKAKLDMVKVQNKYIKFQSELLLQEVTAQQQGIEIYNMLLENLFINQQQSGVENQIKSLFEMNAATNENAENWVLFILACLGVLEFVEIIGEWIFGIMSQVLGESHPWIEYVSEKGDWISVAFSLLLIVLCYKGKNRKR